MAKCCTGFSDAATDQFGAAVARRDAANYRRRGPDKPTRLLRDAVLAAEPRHASLLDIGGGIGALSLELTAAGVGRATLVDASASYLSAAQEEAVRLGRADRLDVVAGDFVEIAATVAPADIVAMNRVVCCYPDFRALLTAALNHAGRLFAFSYPKRRWYIQAVVEFGNAIRAMTGKAFRTFVHDEAAMHALIEAHGFRREARGDTFVWQIEVWTRVSGL
jgi:2-polyprenyl-3-methyl-5-hydroxy-6-metoxy-1,4-benzoquinol methylase